jgi:hypothetical protein
MAQLLDITDNIKKDKRRQQIPLLAYLHGILC